MVIHRLQRLTVNFSGHIRQTTYRGRTYLVAPMTLINPGVLSGSKGPLLYPPEEIARNARQWNGVPITIYHPHSLGQPVSARHPGILDRQGVGVVRNACANGKLKAEGWFDAERLRKVNPGVYARLTKGEPVELSTGLYTENEETSGTFHGRPYTAIARNYRADHLAVLPDQVGACSIADGCGVLVNRRQPMSLRDKLSVLTNADQVLTGTDSEERKALAAHGELDEEDCDVKKNCSKSLQNKLVSILNESEEQKDSEEEDTVRLKTDRPTSKDAKDADEAAGAHDLFPRIAESPLEDDDLEATELFGDDWQDHLDDAEEENEDTEVKINTWTDEDREKYGKKKVHGSAIKEMGSRLQKAKQKFGNHPDPDMRKMYKDDHADHHYIIGRLAEGDHASARSVFSNMDTASKDDFMDLVPREHRHHVASALGTEMMPAGMRHNSLSRKLAGLVGNWDGPPRDKDEDKDEQDDGGGGWDDEEDSDAEVEDLGPGAASEGQPQAGPPQPAAPAAAPQVPPTAIQPPDPNVWLQKQIGMLIAKYMEIQGKVAGPPAAGPPQQPPQVPPQAGPPLGNRLRRKIDFLIKA